MINEQDGPNEPEQIDPALIDQAVNQARTDGLRLSYNLTPEEQGIADGNVGEHEPTPDEVWEYFAANRTKTFDKTTAEGKRLYELFRIANKERNKFTMEAVKEMANVVAKVPVDIVKGVVSNPLKAPMSALDGVARDVRDLYGILAQSEDPDSVFFRFKDYINGTGSIEDQIDQFNEARWFNNRSTELEEGRATVLEDWVPSDYKGFVKNLIDPKLANALSYIGLDTPHILMGMVKKSGKRSLRESMKAYKGVTDMAQAEALGAADDLTTSFRDHYDNTAKRMKEFAMRTTGMTVAGTADVVAKPFSYVQQKIAQGSSAIAETSGQNATVLRNAAQTALADAGERAVGEGLALSPIRSTLFSFGVKPLTEYASVLGNEIVDYANGVVQVKPSQIGVGMLERLATKNGSKVPLSAEALAVAKFTNVVVGWPASMAVPVLKRAVGDAAYMGVLGYFNARGAGAASGVGIGFAWGGLSGSLRHIHNVYSQKEGHAYVIDNFDKAQINMIEAKNPETAKHMRETLKAIDGMNDTRIGATIRAAFAQAFTVDPSVQYRYATKADLLKEFGGDPVSFDIINKMSEQGLGATISGLRKNGGEVNVIWANKNNTAPETIVHEVAHLHLNNVFKNDADSVEVFKQFFGSQKDAGVISDDAMAHLIADYKSKHLSNPALRKAEYDLVLADAKGKLNSLRTHQNNAGSFDVVALDSQGHTIPQGIKDAEGSRLSYQPDGSIRTVPDNLLKEIVNEMFAHSYSNSVLNKSPDYFIRNPEYRSLRASLENLYMLRTQRLVSKIEQAGILIKPTNPLDGNTQMSTFMWEDGKYLHMPMLDAWAKTVVAQALRHGDINVSLMSPERAEAYFKQTGKERFANAVKGGKVMKGKKEVDEIISQNTEKVITALESLPENERPRFNINQGGNKLLDMTTLNKKQWDSISNAGIFSKDEMDQLRGLTEMVRNVRAGKPVFNTVTAQYLGRTHQVVIDGQVRRLTGSDVPVTNRHFSPYAVELRYDNFDEYGNPLKSPKGHITIHAVDVRVLNRRRLKMWQRPDVRSLFTDFGHYTRTFADYMDNLSQDASSRKTSVERFKPEFGDNAEAVRDIMYETFGGRKRMDESFINTPKSGYSGNSDGPNYPFHSLRFELLANLETQPSVFQETFGNKLMALPYNHANAYEGVRRNMMVGGFVEYPIGQDKKYWGNHVGYEIRQSGSRLNLFSPFGTLLGAFKTLSKAQSYAERHMRNVPQEEGRGMVGTEQGPSQEGDLDISVNIQDISSGRANMMVGEKGYYRADVNTVNNDKWDNFIQAAKDMKYMSADHSQRSENAFYGQASIKLKDVLGDERLLADYPWIGDFEIVASPLAVLHGGYVEGIWGSRNGRTILALPVSHIEGAIGRGAAQSIKAVLQGPLQELISFSEGRVTSNRLAYVDGDIRYIGNSAMMYQMKRMKELLDEQKKSNPNATFDDVLEAERDKNIESTLKDFWRYDISKRNAGVGFLRSSLMEYGMSKDDVRKVEAHVMPILDAFSGKRPKNYVIQSMNSTTVFVAPELLRMPSDVESILNRSISKSPSDKFEGATTLRDIYDMVFMRGISGFHHVSKLGDRTARNGRTSVLHDVEIESNAMANSQGRVHVSGSPNMEAQTVIALNGIENYAIFTIGRTADPTERNMNNSVTFVTPATSFSVLSFNNDVGRGVRPTTDMQVFPSKWAPLATLGASKGGINVSINSIMAMNGLSPFLYGEAGDVIARGSLYKHVESGRFSDILEYMYANAFPKEYAELMQSSQGVNPFRSHTKVRRIATSTWTKGINTPEEQAVFHYATYLSQVLTGMEIVNGTEFGKSAAELFRKDIARTEYAKDGKPHKGQKTLSDASFFSDQFIGAGSVNEGVARIMLLAERMGWGSITGGREFENFVKSRSEDPDSAKSASAFVKQLENVGAEIEGIVKGSGFDKTKPLSPVRTYGSAQMMVGGFFGSMNATERMMEAAGMLRLVRTDNGIAYKAFEFSDKGASLILGAVDEKIHLLPFINDLDSPQKGYDSFIKDYTAAVQSNDAVAIQNLVNKIPMVKLGDILKHDLLYRFYPSLKNVDVGFVEGFGASFNPRQNVIRIGIDRIISGSIAEANGVSSDHVLIPESVRIKSVVGSLIHEVQHAVQRLETWTQSADISQSAQYRRGVFKYLVRNMMGLEGALLSPLADKKGKGIEAEIEMAKEAGLDDAEISKALELSPQEIEKHMMELLDSPLAQRVGELAIPNAIQLFMSDAMVLERLSHEMTQGTAEATKMAELAKEMLTLHEQAVELKRKLDDGAINAEQARAVLVGKNESLYVLRTNLYEIIESTMGKDVASLAYEYSSHHNKYAELMLDVTRLTDVIKHDPRNGAGFNSVRLRYLIESLGLMQYYGQMHEKQAYETASRRDMGQDELNQSVRPSDDIFGGTTTLGSKNNLRQLGVMLKEGRVPRVNMMIGGYGIGQNVQTSRADTQRLEILRRVARMSTISYYGQVIDQSIKNLGRYIVSAKGWEVIDGKARLVYKTGIIQQNDNKRVRSLQGYSGREKTVPVYENMDDGYDTSFAIFNGLSENLQNSISMEEVARLVDGKVILENEIVTPTEAIDAVYRSDFPEYVDVNELHGVLSRMGVSDDGLLMANIPAIMSGFAGSRLSREELANVMAINHQFIVAEYAYGSTFGQGRLSKALEKSEKNPQILLNTMRKVWKDNMILKLRRALNEMGVGIYPWNAEHEKPKMQSVFMARKGKIQFHPKRPDFISEADWNEWVSRKKADGTWPKGRGYMMIDTDSIYGTTGFYESDSRLDQKVEMLNMQYAQRVMTLKPFFEAFMSKIDEIDVNLKMSMIDEAILLTTRFEPEAALDTTGRYEGEYQISNFSENDLTNKAQREEFDATIGTAGPQGGGERKHHMFRPFGPSILLGNTFRVTGSASDADLFGIQHVLLPSVGHTFDRTIHSQYVDAFDDGAGVHTIALNKTRDEFGVVRQVEEVKAGYDAGIVNPYKAVYENTGSTNAGNMTNSAVGALRAVGASHQGLLTVIGVMSNQANSNFDRLKRRMKPEALTPEIIQSIEAEKQEIIGTLAGLRQVGSAITEALIDRQGLLIPFNDYRRDYQIVNLRSQGGGVGGGWGQTAVSRTKGFIAKDGSISIESVNENVLNGSTSLNEVVAIPYDTAPNGKGETIDDTNGAIGRLKGVVFSAVAAEIERAFLVNGDVDSAYASNSPSQTLRRAGDVHLALNSVIRNGEPVHQENVREGKNVSLRMRNQVVFTGVHAIHSAFYQLLARKGINSAAISNAVQASPEFLTFLSNTNYGYSNRVAPVLVQGDATYVDMDLYATAMVPVLTKAFSEKTITYIDGNINYGDILNEVQRAMFNELLSQATTATVPVEGQADGFVASVKGFLETLSPTQKTLIAEMCSDVNSNMILESTISGMQGLAAVELIPDSPAMEAIIPNFKQEMRDAVRKYIQTGSYQWEKGVREGIADPVQRKHPDSELPYKNAIFMLLSNGNADAFAKFLIGIKKLNRFEAFEVVRGGKNARLEGVQYGADNTSAGPTVSGLFRGSVRMNEYSWSAINADSSFGDITRKLVLGPDTSTISRTHALEDPTSLGKQSPIYLGVNKIEGVGMGDALLAPLKLDMAEALQQRPPSDSVALSGGKVFIPRKAAAISKPFSRRMLVDAIIKETEKAGTDRVSIQPARNATVGRPFFDKATILRAGGTGLSGKKGVLLDIGIKQIPLGGLYSPVVRDDLVTGSATVNVGSANYGEKASMGYAFKRLEDGRLVINISGDVLGYKNFTTMSQRGGWGDLAIGVNFEEALGYSHMDGSIAPMHMKYWSGNGPLKKETIPVSSLMDVQGAAWRIEILKKAKSMLNGGVHAVRNVNQKLMLSESGPIMTEYGDALRRIQDGTASHGNVQDVLAASAIIRDSSTDNYLTLTIDAGLSQEEVLRKVMTFMLDAVMVRQFMKDVGQGFDYSNQDYNSFSSTLAHSRTNEGSGIITSLFSETSMLSKVGSTSARISEGGELGGNIQSALENYVLAVHRAKGSGSSAKSSLNTIEDARGAAERTFQQYPHLLGDIEKLVTMATSSDHGYFMPDVERTLAMNGEKKAIIEQLFPNRPELTQFAWDNTSNSNVTIVPKREGKKIVSYLVGYDIPSGIDKSTGQVTMSRRVTSVKTLSEAEALKAKYSLSTTKAELANAIETLSNRSGKFAVTTIEGGKSQFAPVRRNATHKLSEVEKNSGTFTLSYGNADTYTVGDLDLRLTKEQAEALSAQLSLPEAIQAQVTPRVNMMVGEQSSNAKELESLLRRKINFGVGMGRVEFSSKLMSVIAHGKAKNGKNKYPETMTGAEWYKFIRENAVSKDEIRMSGLAFLLNDNKNNQISRGELAEFVFTTYPRNFRQDRGGPLGSMDFAEAIRQPIPNSQFVYPFIFNIESKEAQVAQAHVSNMNNILMVLDGLRQSEPEKATALETAISRTIDELIDVAGLPKEMGEGTLKERFDRIISVVNGQYAPENFNPNANPSEYITGSSRRIRPMQLDIIVRSAIEAKMTDVNGIVNTIVPESALSLVDPWNWAYSHHGMGFTGTGVPSANVPMSSNRKFINDPRVGNIGRNDQEVWQQGVIFSGGNSHDGYATYRGSYTSSIWLTELWSPRMREEFENFSQILNRRKSSTTNPEDIRRIDSILKSVERVAVIRSAWNEHNNDNMGNAGHYDTKMRGMFQLGHIRTTAGVMIASHGAESMGQGQSFLDETNKVLGVQKEVEPTFFIEEIQSDTFQYRRFGDPQDPEFAMPDSLEQAEGLKNVSEMTKLKAELSKLESEQSDTLYTLGEFAGLVARAGHPTNVQLYRRLMPAFLGTVGQVERYLIKRDFEKNHGEGEPPILVESGGTIKLTEEEASYLGVSEIPRLEWDFISNRRLLKGMAEGAFKAMTPAFYEILGNMFGIREISSMSESIFDPSQMNKSHSATPMLLIMQYAMMDEQAQMSAQEFKRALLNRSNPNFDFNAMADRLIDRVEKAVNAWSSNDPVFNRNSYSTKFAKVKTLRAFVQMLKDMRKEGTSAFTISTFDISGSESQAPLNDENSSAWREAIKKGQDVEIINYDRYSSLNDGVNAVFARKEKSDGDVPYGMTRKPEEYENKNPSSLYAIRPRSEVANNALAKLLLNTMGAIAAQAEVGDTPKRMAQIRASMVELSKKIPVSVDNGPKPQIISSQPYGIEDIYRPISMQGTVLRAANAGYRQVGMTDARHHFVRGHTSETRIGMVLGRKKRVFVNIEKDNNLAQYGIKLLRMLPENRFSEVHGRFFERLGNMEDEELKQVLYGTEFEHNGVRCGFHRHCILAVKDAPELLAIGDSRIRDIHGRDVSAFSDGRDGIREMGLQWSITNLENMFTDVGNALLSDDGKPVAYRKATSGWWAQNYGELVSGEKNDTQRQLDSAAANFDRVWFMSESNRGSGYIGNYGLPMWYLKMNYVGQSDKNLVKFATDAFERPVLEMGQDGMYRILDRKTAKLILESNEPERVREVLLQNSKYLGSLPYIGSFLSQWKDVGAYVFSGYGHGVPLDHKYITSDQFTKVEELMHGESPILGFTSDNLSNRQVPEMTFHPNDGQIKDRRQVYIRGSETLPEAMTAMNHTVKNGAGRAWRQIPTSTENLPLNVITKLGFGLEPTDVNMAKVLRLMNSNGGTIFRFAPNFQTDAQRTAFRQKAIAGIPSMMVGERSPDGTPEANPRLLEWLTNVASNYEKSGKSVDEVNELNELTRKIIAYRSNSGPEISERVKMAIIETITQPKMSLEEIAKRNNANKASIQAQIRNMRDSGIKIPLRPAVSWLNPESVVPKAGTGRYTYSQELKDSVRLMASSGTPYRAIAEHHGIGYGTVRRILNEPQKARDYRPERADPTEPYGGPHA